MSDILFKTADYVFSDRVAGICIQDGKVSLHDDVQIPKSGRFIGEEQLEEREFKIEFYWVPLEDVGEMEAYPTNASGLIKKLDSGVQHFVYTEL